MVAPQVSILKVGVRFPCAAFDFLAQTLSIWIGQRDFYLESWRKVGGSAASRPPAGAASPKAKSSSQYISRFISLDSLCGYVSERPPKSGYISRPSPVLGIFWNTLCSHPAKLVASKHGESAFVRVLFLCRYISKKPTSEEAVNCGRYASSDPEIYQPRHTSPAATDRNDPSLAKGERKASPVVRRSANPVFLSKTCRWFRSVSPVRQLSLESIRLLASPALKRMGLEYYFWHSFWIFYYYVIKLRNFWLLRYKDASLAARWQAEMWLPRGPLLGGGPSLPTGGRLAAVGRQGASSPKAKRPPIGSSLKVSTRLERFFFDPHILDSTNFKTSSSFESIQIIWIEN